MPRTCSLRTGPGAFSWPAGRRGDLDRLRPQPQVGRGHGRHRLNRTQIAPRAADDRSHRRHSTAALDALELDRAAVGKEDRFGGQAVCVRVECDARPLRGRAGVGDVGFVVECVRSLHQHISDRRPQLTQIDLGDPVGVFDQDQRRGTGAGWRGHLGVGASHPCAAGDDERDKRNQGKQPRQSTHDGPPEQKRAAARRGRTCILRGRPVRAAAPIRARRAMASLTPGSSIPGR